MSKRKSAKTTKKVRECSERTELPCLVKSSVPGIQPTQEIARSYEMAEQRLFWNLLKRGRA